MRLINADELAIYIDCCQCCSKCNNKHFHCDDACELPDGLTEQWKRVIDEQPTVDPVKHGRWVNYGNAGHYFCSNCNAWDMHSKTAVTNYCWHCGARMDEVSE